jgi:hypothetical protein
MNYLKTILIIVIMSMCFYVTSSEIHAQIPDIEGHVLVAGTNAPVPGVWVKLTNDAANGDDCPIDQSRFAKTDANGKYIFKGWTQMSSSERHIGELIDSNLDGTKDATWYPTYDSCKPDDETPGSIFSCGRDPFAMEVIKPYNWSGTFDSIPKTKNGVCIFCINNGVSSTTAPTMYYHTEIITPTRGSGSVTPTSRLSNTPSPRPIVPTTVASCSFTNVSSTKNIRVDTPDYITVGISQNGGTVDEVTFTSDNGNVVSVCQSPLCNRGVTSYTDGSPSFQTGLTGFSPGQSANIRITGRMISEGITCTPSNVKVTVTDAGSWCQFKETDAVTNGSISCNIPNTCTSAANCDNNLILYDSNESPGIATANGSINSGFGDVSTPIPPYGWEARTAYSGITYSYDYFYKKTQGLAVNQLTFPRISSVSDLINNSSEEGYHWIRYQGGATLELLEDINIGNNKVVLFVENSDFVVKGNIKVNKGKGFFMVITTGNIIIDPEVGGTQESTPVADLEGIYFTNKQFKTGTVGDASDEPLHVRGAVVAFDKIVMERSLSDNSKTAAELFEFGPDQLLMFPPRLGEQSYDWKEVAP